MHTVAVLIYKDHEFRIFHYLLGNWFKQPYCKCFFSLQVSHNTCMQNFRSKGQMWPAEALSSADDNSDLKYNEFENHGGYALIL